MDAALARQRLGEPADLVHQPARRNGRVIREGLVSDVDELEHLLGALGQRAVAQHTARATRSHASGIALAQLLLEAQSRSSAAGLRADLDLVGDRADDCDAEAAL